jgi:hypothetical protein
VDGALNAGRPFARWKNLYNGFEFGTVGVEAGAAHLHFARVSPSTGAREPFVLAPESVALFVDESNIAPWDDRLGAHLCRE